jgi:hypothetical protein
MTYKPDPANDAYTVIPTPAELRWPSTDWWTVATREQKQGA